MGRLKKPSVILVLSLLLLFGGSGGLRLSPIGLAASPHRYDLLKWELTNLPDKWVHKLKSFLPWNSRSREERVIDVLRFFELSEEISSLEHQLASLPRTNGRLSIAAVDPNNAAVALTDRMKELEKRRSRLKPGVEETLESEISAVLEEEGISFRIGLIFPPVDLVLARAPKVLVISPRDRIDRRTDRLLEPDMSVQEMEALEDKIFLEQDLAALVEGIGGIATYPTIVRDGLSLKSASVIAAHEWLHTYWFFRPLGWNIFDGAEMRTLNETAADVAGEELGERVYQAITGKSADEDPTSDEESTVDDDDDTEDQEEGRFEFGEEMRRTRVGTDELLAEGKVEEAEAYMEERRLLFAENGFLIRKLNQAYFAFHGTYATSPASVSPIGDEVQQLRSITDSLGDFIKTVAGFGSYQEFQNYLSQRPDTAATRPLAGVGQSAGR